MVHKNLKPSNIIMSPNYMYMLMDAGIRNEKDSERELYEAPEIYNLLIILQEAKSQKQEINKEMLITLE